MFSKASNTVYVTSKVGPDTKLNKGEEIKGHGLEKGHSRKAQYGCCCGRHLEGTYKQTLSMTVSALQSFSQLR